MVLHIIILHSIPIQWTDNLEMKIQYGFVMGIGTYLL